MKHIYLIFACVFLTISFAFADGTKQFMPNCGTEENPQPKGVCYLSIGAREGGDGISRPFARYQHSTKEHCDDKNRLHIRIEDPEHERIHFGFGYGTTKPKLKYRLCDAAGNVVIGGTTGLDLPSNGDGYIGYYSPSSSDLSGYKKAYYGPKSIAGEKGYDYIEYIPTTKGDYFLEFDNESDFGIATGNSYTIRLFDVTVVNTDVEGIQYDGNNKIVAGTAKPIDGRVWSKTWGLNTDGSDNETWTTFYTMSDDSYVSKVYLSGFKPYQFVIACNSYGSVFIEGDMEESRRSMKPTADPSSDIPQYKVFLTTPDPDYWGHAKIPNVPEKLSFAGDAMTCEDLIFVVQLLYNENATLELKIDTDGDDIADKTIASLLQASQIRDRGFHYPWKTYTEIKEAGQVKYFYNPISSGCARRYSLSLFDQSYQYIYKYYQYSNDVRYRAYDNGDGSYSYLKLNESTKQYDLIPVPNSDISTKIKSDIDQVNSGDSIWVMSKTKEEAGKIVHYFDDDDFTLVNEYGTEKNPVPIRNQRDLEAFQYAVNNNADYEFTIDDFYYDKDLNKSYPRTFTITNDGGFEGQYFYLIANTGSILLNDWEGIGTDTNPFKGTFRAGRYSPDPVNDNQNSTNVDFAGDQDTITLSGISNGLFGVCEGATLDNIHVKGSITASAEDAAGICAYATDCKISHCTNACNIIQPLCTEGFSVGGIVGYSNETDLDSCYNYGTVSCPNWTMSGDENSAIGGVVGYTDGSITFCYNIGLIGGANNVGGIAGYCFGDIINSRNDGMVYKGVYVGGIAGSAANKVKECNNKGNVVNGTFCAGIYANGGGNVSAEYCINDGIVGPGSSATAAITLEAENIVFCVSTVACKKYDDDEEIENIPAEWYNGEEQIGEINAENKGDIYTMLSNLNYSYTYEDEGESKIDYENYFYIDGDGNLKLMATECCGQLHRQEDAGRLFKSSTTFYIKWDGKNSEGNCVTGEVTVNYQKNSGVTHFPFYDCEKKDYSNHDEPGLVVYRISPMTDEMRTQAVNLPDGYYTTDVNHIGDEVGVELNLFWDDTKVSLSGSCSSETYNGNPIGKTVTTGSSYTENYCTSYKKCSSTGTVTDPKTKKKYTYCKKFKSGGTCNKYTPITISNEETNCYGIENVSVGGYQGSVMGGHVFPKVNYGNEYTINTWWNGVEIKQEVPLILTEHEPAILAIILPITISKWIATSLEESVLLEWTTASEENNDYFTIERSIDGVRWVALGTVKGFGTTSIAHDYSFEDLKPVSGISYYRLKQTDYNGAYTYSSIKCINRPTTKNNAYKVYSIANEDVFVVEGEAIAACEIEVFNTLGVKVSNISFYPTSTSRVVIDVKNLPLGTYIIKSCNTSKQVIKNW